MSAPAARARRPGKREMQEEIAYTRKMLQAIVALSSGWDEHGSLGPRPPLSWETVGRMAMDYARAALEGETNGD